MRRLLLIIVGALSMSHVDYGVAATPTTQEYGNGTRTPDVFERTYMVSMDGINDALDWVLGPSDAEDSIGNFTDLEKKMENLTEQYKAILRSRKPWDEKTMAIKRRFNVSRTTFFVVIIVSVLSVIGACGISYAFCCCCCTCVDRNNGGNNNNVGNNGANNGQNNVEGNGNGNEEAPPPARSPARPNPRQVLAEPLPRPLDLSTITEGNESQASRQVADGQEHVPMTLLKTQSVPERLTGSSSGAGGSGGITASTSMHMENN